MLFDFKGKETIKSIPDLYKVRKITRNVRVRMDDEVGKALDVKA